MRRFDLIILAAGLIGALSWAYASGRDGFKGSNALIIARSISIVATIDGQVDNNPPTVGTLVNSSELLVRIHNNRIDQSRLVEYESEIEYLEHEIDNIATQQQELSVLLKKYQQQADAHLAWMLKDSELRKEEARNQLEIAEKNQQLKLDNVGRMAKLYRLQHASSVTLTIAETEAGIAADQVELNRTILERNGLLQRSLLNNGMFFDNGDASYWDKMTDTLTLRYLDNLNKTSTLNAQMTRYQAQAEVERARIGSSIEEEHLAPFAGMVNATYVTPDARVTSGTALLEVLDCANPIVIIPIPEHRIAEFSVGMKVTVYPVDTRQELSGSIKYISSGPLIGNDRSLQVQEDLTLSGVNAIVSFDISPGINMGEQTCESAHKAVVVIHTDSVYNSVSEWLAYNF